MNQDKSNIKDMNGSIDNNGPIREPDRIASVKKYVYYAILLVIVIIFMAQNIAFISRDTAIQHTDHHAYISSIYHQYFSSPAGSSFPRDWYPPVVYFITHIFYKILGGSIASARFSILFFAPIFIISMYGIGLKFGDEISGLTVAALAASSPYILNTSRSYFPDFPQMAMTALCFFLLLRSEEYRDKKFSILLGIGLGLSFLTKWSSPFFLTIPVIWFILPHLFRNKKAAICSLIAFGFIGFLAWRMFSYPGISGGSNEPTNWLFYYFLNFVIPVIIVFVTLHILEKRLTGDEDPPDNGFPNVLNFIRTSGITFLLISPWLLYSALDIRYKFFFEHKTGDRTIQFNEFILKFLINMLKTHFNLAILLIPIGLIFMIVCREKWFKKLILPVNIAFCILLMSYIGHTEARYSLSIIIFTATLGGYWVYYSGKSRLYIAGILVTISLVSIGGWLLIPDSPIFHRITRDKGAVVFDRGIKNSFKLLSGDIPHNNPLPDFSFVALEIKRRGKPEMKIKVIDRIDFPRFFYPPPSLTDTMIDAALKYDIPPGPIGDLAGPPSMFGNFLILHMENDSIKELIENLKKNHPEDEIFITTRDAGGKAKFKTTLVIFCRKR